MLSHFHMGHESHAADSKPQRLHADETPHAAIGSSSCCERGQCRRGEADRLVELLAGRQAVVELAEHAVEQAAEGDVIAIPCVSSALVVSVGSE